MVVRGPYGLLHNGTEALEFKLKSSGRIVRYCEIKDAAPGVHVGSTLKEGDLIAFVGKMHGARCCISSCTRAPRPAISPTARTSGSSAART